MRHQKQRFTVHVDSSCHLVPKYNEAHYINILKLWCAAAEAFSGLSVGLAPCPIATSLSLTTGISAASAELPGLSALPKTRFSIAGSVCSVGQWIRDEWNLKMLRSLRSFRSPQEKAIQCRRGLFGRHPKTSSGPSDLTRSLPRRALRPAFR